MSFGKIYGYKSHGRTLSALVLAKVNGLDLELVHTIVPNKTPEYLAINGLGKIPTLVTADGFNLSETLAIAVYIAKQNKSTSLIGKTDEEYASVLRWVSYVNSDLHNRLANWFRPLVGKDPYVKESVEEAQRLSHDALRVVDDHLATRTYFVGESVTLADYFTASILSLAFAFLFDKPVRDQYPNLTRWFLVIADLPDFKAVETTKLAEKALTYKPPQ